MGTGGGPMTRPLIERRCQLCKHYEPSKTVHYAGVCRSFAIYDEEMLVHRDSWCGRWAEKSAAALKRDFTSAAKQEAQND